MAIVGDEAAVAAALQGLVDAGATDIWASIFPVAAASRAAAASTNSNVLVGTKVTRLTPPGWCPLRPARWSRLRIGRRLLRFRFG